MRALELVVMWALHAGISQTMTCSFGTCAHLLQIVRSNPGPFSHGKSPVNLAGSSAGEQVFREQIRSDQDAAAE